jgi:hypothetical protein
MSGKITKEMMVASKELYKAARKERDTKPYFLWQLSDDHGALPLKFFLGAYAEMDLATEAMPSDGYKYEITDARNV